MITVTNNSVQQINAALLTLNSKNSASNQKLINNAVEAATNTANINLLTTTENITTQVNNSIAEINNSIDEINTQLDDVQDDISGLNTNLIQLRNNLNTFGGQYIQPFSGTISLSKYSDPNIQTHRAAIGHLAFGVSYNSYGVFCSVNFKGWKYFPSQQLSAPEFFMANVDTNARLSSISWTSTTSGGRAEYDLIYNDTQNTIASVISPCVPINGGPAGINALSGGIPKYDNSVTVSFVMPPDVTRVYFNVVMSVNNDSNDEYIPSSIELDGFALQRLGDIRH